MEPRKKKNYWVSLDPETGILLELHRFDKERDSEFCRRIVRRFLKENPDVVPIPTSRGNRGAKGWVYEYQDLASIQEELKSRGVTLKQVFASIAKLKPTEPINDEWDLLQVLEGEFGRGIIPLYKVVDALQPYVPMRSIDSSGRILLSELQEQKKLKLRRLHWLKPCRYVEIDGRMYTHVELLSPMYWELRSRPKEKILKLLGDSSHYVDTGSDRTVVFR